MGNNSENIYAEFFLLFEFSKLNSFSTKHIIDILSSYFFFQSEKYNLFDVFNVGNVVAHGVFVGKLDSNK